VIDSAITIRPASWNDISSLISLERQVPTAAHWTESRYRRLLHPSGTDVERLVLVAESGAPWHEALAGFFVARHIASEWELENLVVASAYRRQGLGEQLLQRLLARARETNSESVFLEVRESNDGARALYEKTGFQPTGHRKSYYIDPSEDAVLYRLTLR
jgi:[ribosomal protein S18]-alanine N-acetyltransferase